MDPQYLFKALGLVAILTCTPRVWMAGGGVDSVEMDGLLQLASQTRQLVSSKFCEVLVPQK